MQSSVGTCWHVRLFTKSSALTFKTTHVQNKKTPMIVLCFRKGFEELPTFFWKPLGLFYLCFCIIWVLILYYRQTSVKRNKSCHHQLNLLIISRGRHAPLFGTSQAILVLLSLSRNELGLYMVKTSLNAVNYYLSNELNSAFQLGMWIAMYIL